MSRKLYMESSVKNIADSIRKVNGSETKYKISEMDAAIDSWAPRYVKFQIPDDDDELDLTGFNPKNLITMEDMASYLGGKDHKIKPIDLAYVLTKNNKSSSTFGMFQSTCCEALYSSFNEPLYALDVETAQTMFYDSKIDRIDAPIVFSSKLQNTQNMFGHIDHPMMIGETPGSELNQWGLVGFNGDEMFGYSKHLECVNFGNRENGVIAPSGSIARMFSHAEYHSDKPFDLRAFDFSDVIITTDFFVNTVIESRKILFPEKPQTFRSDVRLSDMFNFDHWVSDYSGLKFIKIDEMSDDGYIGQIINTSHLDVVDLRNITFSKCNFLGAPGNYGWIVYAQDNSHRTALFIVKDETEKRFIQDNWKWDDGTPTYQNLKTVKEYEGG